MATISKTKSNTYRAQVRRVGQPTLSKSFNSKQEAQEWASKIDVYKRQIQALCA